MSVKTVFMGSSDFSARVLEILAQKFSISAVITQPDKPAGRGKTMTPPPVKVLAGQLRIPVMQPAKLRAPEAFEQLSALQPELIVVAAYGQILRQNVLDLPKYGCINVHASLLPRWRGASPIQAAILNGDAVSGVTIMKMDAGIDTGPELAKASVEITPDETSLSLSDKLAEVGGELLVETLPKYLEGSLSPAAQDETGACYASLIKKEDGLLDFTSTAEELERKVRAYFDWPGAFVEQDGQILKVRRAEVSDRACSIPGRRGICSGYPCVGTRDGELVLLEVQPAGKKWMDGRDFARGARNWQHE